VEPRAVGGSGARGGRGLRRRCATAALLAALVPALGAACPPPPADGTGRVDPATLPTDPLELLRLAEQWSRAGTTREKKLDALVALERAETAGGDAYVTWVLRARTCLWLAEENDTDPSWGEWVDMGVQAAEAAVAVNPGRVEGHYYVAALVGRQAERATVGALDMVPRIQEEAQRAIDIDRTYDNCGPLLAMGMLLVAAPPWPQSIGDPETGIEFLREAAACSDYPVNRIVLAEALLDQGNFEEARELLRWVLARPPEGLWGVVGNRWRPVARELLERAEHPGQ
jgi:hypothetical protein